MKNSSAMVFPLLIVLLAALSLPAAEETKLAPMPVPSSASAVASLKDGLELYSLMGIGPKKTWDDVSNRLFILHLAPEKWSEGPAVPGVAGRLSAAAAGARSHIILMGGYVMDAQGGAIIVSDVNVYIPSERRWYRGKDIPLAVSNAAVGVNHDRFVYLIGGRAVDGPTNKVQVYDSDKNEWSDGTPFPGTPVFGLAGGLADDEIVIVDGAKKGDAVYVASDECWLGKIDHRDATKIAWSKIPAHPGTARFGIAGGGSNRDHRIFFSGGTALPHNFKGLTADGKPTQPSHLTFAYNLHGHRWETISENTFDPRIDGSGILDTPVGPILIGGMLENQEVTAQTTLLQKR